MEKKLDILFFVFFSRRGQEREARRNPTSFMRTFFVLFVFLVGREWINFILFGWTC